jgi:hypothetical protein
METENTGEPRQRLLAWPSASITMHNSMGSRFAEPLGYPPRTVTRSLSRYSCYAMKIRGATENVRIRSYFWGEAHRFQADWAEDSGNPRVDPSQKRDYRSNSYPAN